MAKVKLANSDLEVSPLCLGCWQFNRGSTGDMTWESQEEKTSLAIVDKCLEIGVNFFDTAEAYSDHVSEAVLGKALQGRRRDAIVASKYGNMKAKTFKAEDIERSLTESLKALNTDYIDLYQIHGSTLVDNMEETVTELKRQQSLGRIRYYAVSNFGVQSLKEFTDAGGVAVTNQLPYNLLWRGIENNVVDSCDQHNIDILAYSPLQQGLLTGKFPNVESVPEGRRRTRHFRPDRSRHSRHEGPGAEEETFKTISAIAEVCKNKAIPSMTCAAVSWLLAKRRVASVITGASRPEQIVQNYNILKLEKDTVDLLDAATQELKEKFGENPDMWAKESRIR